MSWEVRQGDALERLREMPDGSVQCCITSPPYFGLRDYGQDGQIGLEATPDAYVARLVEVFQEVRRVLRDDGCLWLNLGDSYAGGRSANCNYNEGFNERSGNASGQRKQEVNVRNASVARPTVDGYKAKDLLGIPWLVAFALRADGWWLRSEIVWAKPNPMPESVTDRPTRAHEQVFLLTKSARYYFDSDAIREAYSPKAWNENGSLRVGPASRQKVIDGKQRQSMHTRPREEMFDPERGRNKRTVWTVATQPYAEAHFATFPPKLIEPMVLAGSARDACGVCGAPWERVVEREKGDEEAANRPKHLQSNKSTLSLSGNGSAEWAERGSQARTTGWQPTCEHSDDSRQSTVLDPFAGAGTTGLVSLRHGRSFIGIELSPEYCELARQRIRDDEPLFNHASEVAA